MNRKTDSTTTANGAEIQHYKDFPNDAGFRDIPETRTPIELKVSGSIPDYVRGVLYRTGPGSYTTLLDNGQLFQVQHWYAPFASADQV